MPLRRCPLGDVLSMVPPHYVGLWERTLLERYGEGSLTSGRPAKVFWLQTQLWHADLRIPLDRPDFSSVQTLEECRKEQLDFIAGQEGFCGLTRVAGTVCTWLRVFDLRPGSALDIGRMEFASEDLLKERGIAEDYLEHWSRKPGSTGPSGVSSGQNALLLIAGEWAVYVKPRSEAKSAFDPYRPANDLDHDELAWRASLELSLCQKQDNDWTITLSNHPWREGVTLSGDHFAPIAEAGEGILMDRAAS